VNSTTRAAVHRFVCFSRYAMRPGLLTIFNLLMAASTSSKVSGSMGRGQQDNDW
jgi:hypothetical protein